MIPVYQPYLTDASREYAREAVDSGWIGPHGQYLERAADALRAAFGYKHVLLTCNGTAACHLAALALKKAYPATARILVPNNVYVAAWNMLAVVFGAEKLCVLRTDARTWCIDVEQIKQVARPGDALLVVHNLGGVVNVPAIKAALPWLPIVEDNCEGLGGLYGEDRVSTGTAALVSSLSFFANKTLTSVTYDTPVLIKRDGRAELVEIGTLADDFIGSQNSQRRLVAGMECAAFNVDGSIEWRTVTAVHRHLTSKNTSLMEIKTRKGRTVTITPTHSVFKIEGGGLREVKGRHLKVGDKIAVPLKLDLGFKSQTIDLVELLNGKAGLKYSDSKVMIKHDGVGGGGGKQIDRFLKITPSLCKLLGYFCAEGSWSACGRPVYSFGIHEWNTYATEVQSLFESIWPGFPTKKYRKEAEHGCVVFAGSGLHGEILKRLGVGIGAHHKKIPWAIWESSDECKLAFIDGLLNGDGHRRELTGANGRGSCKSSKLKVASRTLANGLHYLLLTMGVQSRVEIGRSNKDGKQRTNYACEILGGIWEQSNCFEFHGRRIGNVCELEITDIARRGTTDFVYDLEVAGYENFVGGFGAICLHNSGEGGALVSADSDLFEYADHIAHQAMTGTRYVHDEIGYNYRMTNVQAAILLGQIETAAQILELKIGIFARYRAAFEGAMLPTQTDGVHTSSANWMFGVRIYGAPYFATTDRFMRERGVEVRPMFPPIHAHEHLTNVPAHDCAVARALAREVIILPSYPALTIEDQTRVIDAMLEYVKGL